MDEQKMPGQLTYEQFCRDEYAKPEHRVWNRWETLLPEEQTKWAEQEMLYGPPSA